jgi:hypothetical protein
LPYSSSALLLFENHSLKTMESPHDVDEPPAVLTRKQRKAQRNSLKRETREKEDRIRVVKRETMIQQKSQRSLVSFIGDPDMTNIDLHVAQQLEIAIWDTELLAADAKSLLENFTSGLQFGDTHDGKWKTLNLRSFNGECDNDTPAPVGEVYQNTDCWAKSSYIVPFILASFPSMRIDRVRLSCIPANCNVAWHCDFEEGQDDICRLHIPVLCSDGFSLVIGGQKVSMDIGTSWIGNFQVSTPVCHVPV